MAIRRTSRQVCASVKFLKNSWGKAMNEQSNVSSGVASVDVNARFDRILNVYGFSVTDLSVVAIFFIGAFGLVDFLDPALCLATAFIWLAIISLVRNSISSNVNAVLGWSLVCAAVAAIGFAYIYFNRETYIRADILERTELVAKVFTFLISSIVFIPVGLAILSSQKAQLRAGLVYPKVVESAISTELLQQPLYRKDVIYEVSLKGLDAAGNVELRIRLSYSIINRSKESVNWRIPFPTSDKNADFNEISIDGKKLQKTDLNSNQYGYEKEYIFPPGKAVDVFFDVTLHYDRRTMSCFLLYRLPHRW